MMRTHPACDAQQRARRHCVWCPLPSHVPDTPPPPCPAPRRYAQVLATMRMHAAMLGAALGGLTLAAAKQLGMLVTVAAELPAVELPMT